MQLKIFTIPIIGGEEVNEEMNRFLRGHRLVTVDKQFCLVGDTACWTFCVTYVEGNTPSFAPKAGEIREKVDYKTVLDENTFAVFSRLREIRKALAAEDAVPAYAVFTDAELAEISKLQQLDEKTLLTLKGIGSARVEKYGRKICQRYNEQTAAAAQ
ncbi:MAG: HRDC domain-containing protein [Bacteroidales bacterium]|nr:HRDC domain-containing protein [Bacteroidales bacterium]